MTEMSKPAEILYRDRSVADATRNLRFESGRPAAIFVYLLSRTFFPLAVRDIFLFGLARASCRHSRGARISSRSNLPIASISRALLRAAAAEEHLSWLSNA
jgi:hypothetical protein